jgi:hypothetical protein
MAYRIPSSRYLRIPSEGYQGAAEHPLQRRFTELVWRNSEKEPEYKVGEVRLRRWPCTEI